MMIGPIGCENACIVGKTAVDLHGKSLHPNRVLGPLSDV